MPKRDEFIPFGLKRSPRKTLTPNKIHIGTPKDIVKHPTSYIVTDQYGYISEKLTFERTDKYSNTVKEIHNEINQKHVMSPTKKQKEENDEADDKDGLKSPIWDKVERDSWITKDFMHRTDREKNPEYY